MKKGFILVETCFVFILLIFSLTSLVPVILLSLKINTSVAKIRVATNLSQALLEEVLLRRWDEATPLSGQRIASPSVLGVDGSENALRKTAFDDIDDFDGWTESPPRDPLMNVLTNFSDFSRSVEVSYVSDSLAVQLTPTNLKNVQVCTSAAGLRPICLDTVVANR